MAIILNTNWQKVAETSKAVTSNTTAYQHLYMKCREGTDQQGYRGHYVDFQCRFSSWNDYGQYPVSWTAGSYFTWTGSYAGQSASKTYYSVSCPTQTGEVAVPMDEVNPMATIFVRHTQAYEDYASLGAAFYVTDNTQTYCYSSNSVGWGTVVLPSIATAPVVSNVAVSNITEDEATFTASVSDGGSSITNWSWEISDDNVTFVSAVLRSGATYSQATAYALGPSGTEWYARLVVTNAIGTTTSSSVGPFTMAYPPPIVSVSTSATPDEISLYGFLEGISSQANLPVMMTLSLYSDAGHTQLIDSLTKELSDLYYAMSLVVGNLSPDTTYYFTAEYYGKNTLTGYIEDAIKTELYGAPTVSYTTSKTETSIGFDNVIMTGGNPSVHTADLTISLYSDSTYTTLVDSFVQSGAYIGDYYSTVFSSLQTGTTYYYKILVQSSGCEPGATLGAIATLSPPRLKLYEEAFIKNDATTNGVLIDSNFVYSSPELCYDIDFQFIGELTNSGAYKHLFSTVFNRRTNVFNVTVYDRVTSNLNGILNIAYGNINIDRPFDPNNTTIYKRHKIKWVKNESTLKMDLYLDDNFENSYDINTVNTASGIVFFNKQDNISNAREGYFKLYNVRIYTISNGVETTLYNYVPYDNNGTATLKDTISNNLATVNSGSVLYNAAGMKTYPVMLSQNGGTYTDVSRNVKVSTNGESFN